MVISVSNVVILVLIVMVMYFIYTSIFKSYKEGMKGKKDCLDGCVKPKKLSDNCSEKVFKDKKGNCFKKCPYECSDPFEECQYDKNCMGCGFKKLKIKCDGTMTPDVNESKDNEDKEDKGDKGEKGEGYLKKFEGGMGDEMKHLSSGIQNLFKNKFKTEHHVHVHHHVKQPACPNARKGGILSDQYKNLPRRKHKKCAQDIYNWGAPGTPLDLANEVKNFGVDYTNRPTTTGMFTNTGPYGFNIGDYKPYGKGCDFPVNN